MPLYDYHCRDCDKDFLIEARITDSRDNVGCSHCEGQDVYRVFSAVGLTAMPTRGANSLSKTSDSGASGTESKTTTSTETAKDATSKDTPAKETAKTSDA